MDSTTRVLQIRNGNFYLACTVPLGLDSKDLIIGGGGGGGGGGACCACPIRLLRAFPQKIYSQKHLNF